MKKKKKLTPEEIYKKYCEEKNSLKSLQEKNNLNIDAYDYIFAMIQLVNKKTDLHLMLLHVENLLNNAGRIIKDDLRRQSDKVKIYFKEHEKIIKTLSNGKENIDDEL